MRYYVGTVFYGDDIWHYGVKGQKKGVRRYQNPDGSLTQEGYVHYGRNPHPRARKKAKPTFKSFIKKLFGKKSPIGRAVNSRRKIKDVSDEELDARTARIVKEKNYYRAIADRKQAIRDSKKKEEKKMTEGRKFMLDHAWKFSTEVVKKWIEENASDNSSGESNKSKPQKKKDNGNGNDQSYYGGNYK